MTRFSQSGKHSLRVAEVITDHGSSAPIDPPEGIAPALEGLLAQMLDKLPANRPAATEVAERLEAIHRPRSRWER